MGEFTPIVTGTLQQIRTRFYFNNCDKRLGFKIKVYRDSGYSTTLVGTSDTIRVRQLTDAVDYWIGDLTFTLEKACPVTSGQSIYLLLEVDNSHLTTTSNYASVVCDWPLPVDSSIGTHPRTELFINQITELY
jgi:hypothetical protein